MKAQKAAAAVMAAGFMAYSALGTAPFQVLAAEKEPVAALVLDRTAADTDGHFEATLSLDQLPETGLCALEFAIAYDTAALGMTPEHRKRKYVRTRSSPGLSFSLKSETDCCGFAGQRLWTQNTG